MAGWKSTFFQIGNTPKKMVENFQPAMLVYRRVPQKSGLATNLVGPCDFPRMAWLKSPKELWPLALPG